MTDADIIRAVGATRMSHAGTGSVAAALDRIEAQLAHLQATLQRVLVMLERIAGKTSPRAIDDATRG